MKTQGRIAGTGRACLATALLVGCSTAQTEAPAAMGARASALTAAQCEFFQQDGKVQICHRTSAATNPYVVIRISMEACIQGHSGHAGDYVAVNDPYCQGQGCFPVGAPLDAVAHCCEGLVVQDGRCACPADTQCLTYAPDDQGGCTATPRPAGTACDDGFVTTVEDVCEAGTCAGHACEGATCLGTGLQSEAGAGARLYLEGASLTVPETFTLSLRSLVEAPPTAAANGATISARSPIYEFGPAGTVFAQPLTITFEVGPDPDLVLFWSEDGASYVEKDVQIVDGTMTVTVEAFSRAVVARNGCKAAEDLDSYCGTAPAGACAAAPTCQPNGAKLKCTAAFQPATTACRAAAGACDVAEYCSGASVDCPADGIAAAGTLCRAAGTCDLAEYCDGLAPGCPVDAFAATGEMCDDGDPATSDDVCDGLGGCAGTSDPGLLLDRYPGASGAYSLRKLRRDYSGPAIEVRRSFDNATKNIYFDVNGRLDWHALMAFVVAPYGDGSFVCESGQVTTCQSNALQPIDWTGVSGKGNGYVVKWYDQSVAGAGRYAYYAYGKPQGIVIGGGLVGHQGRDGRWHPYLHSFYNNGGQGPLALSSGGLYFKTAFTAAITLSPSVINYLTWTTTGQAGLFYNGTYGGVGFGFYDGAAIHYYGPGDIKQHLGYFNIAGGRGLIAKDGGAAVDTGACPNRMHVNQVAGRADSTALYFRGMVWELVFYDFDQAANKTGIETDITSHYQLW